MHQLLAIFRGNFEKFGRLNFCWLFKVSCFLNISCLFRFFISRIRKRRSNSLERNYPQFLIPNVSIFNIYPCKTFLKHQSNCQKYWEINFPDFPWKRNVIKITNFSVHYSRSKQSQWGQSGGRSVCVGSSARGGRWGQGPSRLLKPTKPFPATSTISI